MIYVKPSATRKSIKTLFPLGSVFSRGINNPITLHAADDDAFARVWSLIAETMVAKSELNRNLKEKVATLVSKKNQCPVCILAHAMMVKATDTRLSERSKSLDDRDESENTETTISTEEYEATVLEYAGAVVEATWSETEVTTTDDKDFSILDDRVKAEVALVVLLFSHMNRVVSAIMGEGMSTALFKSKTPADPQAAETSSFMKTINRLMAPLISKNLLSEVESGCTQHLFASKKKSRQSPGSSASLGLSESSTSMGTLAIDDTDLPTHLEGVRVTGEARARALGRLYQWSEQYYETEVKNWGILPEHLLDFLDDDPAARPPQDTKLSHKIVAWIGKEARALINELDANDMNRSVATLLLYVSYAPKAVRNTAQWKSSVKQLGETRTRALVIWWSVRFALRHAQGLS